MIRQKNERNTVKMKRIWAFVLICFILLPLVACTNTGDVEETTPAITDEPIPEGTIAITDGGQTDYTLITGAYVSSSFQACFGDFEKKLEDLTGADFKTSDDALTTDTAPATQMEIVFAFANREESKELYKSLNYDGYAIKHDGNKILLAAYIPEAIEQAIEAFFNECTELYTTASGKTRLYYVKDKLVKGDRAVLFNGDRSIEDYTIIYSSTAVEAAKKIASTIKEFTGITVPTGLDKVTARGEHEILVGDTDRKESIAFKVTSLTSIGVKVEGEKIIIKGGTPGNINLDVDVIIDQYFASVVPNLPAGIEAFHLAYRGKDRVEFTTEADVRIMSYNILSDDFSDSLPLIPRVSAVIGCILEYKPDVVGLQEVSKNWYKYFKEYLKDEYVLINTNILGKEDNNYTGLAYRKETVELLESDLMFYSVGNNQRLRLINTGVFKLKATGQTFVVTNTHYNANHGGDNTKQRTIQATELIAKIKEYATKYNCPVFSTGDYNCDETTTPYKLMIEEGSLLSSKDSAKETGLVLQRYVDHIFYYGDVTPLYFTTLSDAYLDPTSDHKALFTDFSFN